MKKEQKYLYYTHRGCILVYDNRDKLLDAINIRYEVVPLRLHKGHQNIKNRPKALFFIF